MRFNMTRLEGRLMTPSETFGWLIFNFVMFSIWIVLKVVDTLYPRGCPCLTQQPPQQEQQEHHEPEQQLQHLHQFEHQHQHQHFGRHHEDAERGEGYGHAVFRWRANSVP